MTQPTKDPGYIELELLSGTKSDKEIEDAAQAFVITLAQGLKDQAAFDRCVRAYKAGWKAHEEYIKNKV